MAIVGEHYDFFCIVFVVTCYLHCIVCIWADLCSCVKKTHGPHPYF